MSSQTPINKRDLIREHVPGRSFVDVGGLWGTHGEMVTTAAGAGAASVTMADIQPPDSVWWGRFRDRCREFGVEDCAELVADIRAPETPEKVGTWDFVHCAGIMYHVPDLFSFVGNLIKITGEHLLLSSVTMPDRIDNAHGSIVFGADQAYLAPLLADDHKAIVRAYLEENGLTAAGITNDDPFMAGGVARTGPWWWLFSGAFMSRFVRMYGVDVVAEGPTRTGRGYSVLAKVSR